MKCKWRMEDEPDIEALRVCALLGAVYAARRESVCEEAICWSFVCEVGFDRCA